MEAPKALLEYLREQYARPFGEVLNLLKDCPRDRGHEDLQGTTLPLANLALALGSCAGNSVGTAAGSKNLKPPRRVLVSEVQQPTVLRSSTTILSHRTWPCTLIPFSNTEANKVELQRVQVLVSKHKKDVDLNRPVLKCTTFFCSTFSNLPLLPCPRCSEGIMGLNCTLTGSAGFVPKDAHSWPLTGELVFQYPFVALKEDWEKGLDLKWEGTEGVGTQHGHFEEVLPSPVPLDLGPAMHWCADCRMLQNQAKKDHLGCSICSKRTSWDITFVSADPSEPKKRVYWPQGSIASRRLGGPGETSLCLITDALEVLTEVGPLGAMQLLKAQGIFTLEDVDIVTVQLGPEEVRESDYCTVHTATVEKSTVP